MDKLTYYCDNCGIAKQESNHWWVLEANILLKSLYLYPLEEVNAVPRLANTSNQYIKIKACGLQCLGILEERIKAGVNPIK